MKRLLQKAVGLCLSTTILFSAFPNTGVYAQELKLTTVGGWYEYAFAAAQSDIASAAYKAEGETTFTTVDAELIRGNRVDIPGLKGDTSYTIKIEGKNGDTKEVTVKTMSYNREGYAHFNKSNLGAYNDDGTLKADADVIYVTNSNKNTVKYGGYTGIGNILVNAKKLSKPLAVRFIGKVDTQARDADGKKTTDKNAGIVAIDGLTDQVQSGDSYFNMCDMSNPKNLTLEGIGDDANIEKWGFTIKGGSGVEIRNLTFDLYPEDAVGMQKGDAYSKNIWIHNNHFEKGENKYDRTSEQDKGDGDGSTDIKYSEYITISDNYYHNCHKTSLVGGGKDHLQDYITYARNYFDATSERTPRVRNAHVHVYNNYYKGITGYGVGASYNSKIFTENNYFEGCRNPIDMGPIGSDSYSGTVKSFGDVMVGCKNVQLNSSPVIAASRDQVMNIPNLKKGGDAYDNFDTDKSAFYYGKYNVLTPEAAVEAVVKYSGALGDSSFNAAGDTPVSTTTTESTTETTTESTTETTTVSTTESTTETTTVSTTESTTEATTESTTSKPAFDHMYGDSDNSGSLTSNDVAYILAYVINGTTTPAETAYGKNIALKIMDVDNSGKVEASDASCVLDKVANKDYVFPVEK